MNLYPCEYCGRLMVLRESHEVWKTRCVLCWKLQEGIAFNGADLSILQLEEDLRQKGSETFISDNIKTFLKLCHPDRHGNSAEANKITAWLLDKYQNRYEAIEW